MVDARRARFRVEPTGFRKFEEGGEYKWKVVDAYGELNDLLFLTKRQAEEGAARLRRQHRSQLRAKKNGPTAK